MYREFWVSLREQLAGNYGVFYGIPKKHFEHKVQYTIYNLKLLWLPGLGRIGDPIDPKNCELPWKLEIQFMADLDLGYPSKINWFLKCSCLSYQKGDNFGQYVAAVKQTRQATCTRAVQWGPNLKIHRRSQSTLFSMTCDPLASQIRGCGKEWLHTKGTGNSMVGHMSDRSGWIKIIVGHHPESCCWTIRFGLLIPLLSNLPVTSEWGHCNSSKYACQ